MSAFPDRAAPPDNAAPPDDDPDLSGSEPGNKVMQLVRRAANARAKPLPEGARRILVAVAFMLFVASGVWAWVNRPDGDVAPNWWLLAVAFVLAVPGLYLKAVEFATTAHILGQRPPYRDCLEISVLSSAANLLPVPGSAIVTMRALSENGSTYGAAVTSTAAVSIAWVGATLVYGGVGVAFAGGPIALAAALIVIGLALLVVAWRMIAVHAGDRTLRLWLRTVVIETSFILNSTVRFWLILRAIGIEATVAQSVSLTIAATLANALAFVPGGLGVRELIAAGISPLVDLEAKAGLLMAVFDRIMWLTVLAVAALVVSTLRRRAGGAPTGRRLDDEQGAVTT